jgi:hypothetical protein
MEHKKRTGDISLREWEIENQTWKIRLRIHPLSDVSAAPLIAN